MAFRNDLKKYINIILIALVLGIIFQGVYDTFFYGLKGDNNDAIRSLAAMTVVVILIVGAILILWAWSLMKESKIKPKETGNILSETKKESEQRTKIPINKDTEFFKVQVHSDRIHTYLTIKASLAFVAFSLISIFSALYYQGFFEVKQSMMLVGYIGIAVVVVIVVFAVGIMVRSYLKDFQKISDMIEAVNNGESLPTLAELPNWKKVE